MNQVPVEQLLRDAVKRKKRENDESVEKKRKSLLYKDLPMSIFAAGFITGIIILILYIMVNSKSVTPLGVFNLIAFSFLYIPIYFFFFRSLYNSAKRNCFWVTFADGWMAMEPSEIENGHEISFQAVPVGDIERIFISPQIVEVYFKGRDGKVFSPIHMFVNLSIGNLQAFMNEIPPEVPVERVTYQQFMEMKRQQRKRYGYRWGEPYPSKTVRIGYEKVGPMKYEFR